jgi:hypothetical protein
MARWTRTPMEEQHLTVLSNKMPVSGIVTVNAKNHIFEGLILGFRAGNNFGAGGPLQYYCEFDVMLLNGTKVTVDVLDITDVWSGNQKLLDEFEKQGLITIQR